jgi:CheY-like chemotaxis protein
MDICLPEMTGIEATQEIKKLEQEYGNIHTNIVAVTNEGKKLMEEEKIFDNYCILVLI